ncbi:hypothetical protein M413DRAFT_29915 [Hebeloma cylindrosporum]|uniref:Uncharacterized protein n=1 Tax=Hebeloma cylindrosporum TaxID=76867 RepID=A0A0C3C516_HEBCY|nr:hypothetical protein M413DRAFT_29915 [Hebeloma cylindrosporum h7]
MSLARIPLTFLVCWAFKKCVTPPNPPAARSERMPTNFMEFEWYTQRSSFYSTTIQWMAGILEIVTILAWMEGCRLLAASLVVGPGN